MAITLAQCSGGGHVHVSVDGEPLTTLMFDELAAGNVVSDDVTVRRIQAAILLAEAQDFAAMQAAVEALP